MTGFVCLFCGQASTPAVVSRQLRDDRTGRHAVVRCRACGHVQLFPLPSLEEEEAFYADDQQARLVFASENFVPVLLEKKKLDLGRRIEWLRQRLPHGGRVIEVASGYGAFVDGFSRAGYEAHGIERSPFRLSVARQGMNGVFHEGALDDRFLMEHAHRFDVVFAFHRVLHARDAHAFVRALLALCAPGGIVHIEEPNLGDSLMSEIPEYANHRWQVSHYHYFAPASFEQLLRSAGAGRVAVEGLQRYGLRHLLQWSDHHRPDLSGDAAPPSTPTLARIEEFYRRDREQALTCDSMIGLVEPA